MTSLFSFDYAEDKGATSQQVDRKKWNDLIAYILGTSGPPTSLPNLLPGASTVFVYAGITYAYNTTSGALIANGTDAGAVINAALVATNHVWIKAGTYNCTTAIVFTASGQTIDGDGMNLTILTFDGSTLATLIKNNDTTVRSFCAIRNIKIASTVTNAGQGINLDYLSLGNVENVFIDGVNQAVEFSNGAAFYNYLDNLRITCGGVNGFGVRLQKNENTLIRCRIGFNDSNNATGIIINAHGNHLISPDVESGANIGAIGIDIQASGHNTTIDDVYLENQNINLQLASGVRSFVCMGGVIIDANTSIASNIVDNGAIKPLIKCRLGNTASPADGLGYQDYSSFEPFASARWQVTKGIGTAYKLHAVYWGISTHVEGAIASVTATGTSTGLEDATEGRYTQLATGAVANTPAGHRFSAAFSTRRQNIRCKARFQLPISSLSDYRVVAGLTSDVSAFPSTDDPISTTRSVIAAVKRAADTNWFIGHNDGSGAAVYDDSGIAVSAIGTWMTVSIRADASQSRFAWSINNSAFVNVSSDIPAAGTLLGLWLAVESVNATDARILIPYWEMEADR